MKNILRLVLISALGGILTLGAYKIIFEEPVEIVDVPNGTICT